jgi:hypothetical protein
MARVDYRGARGANAGDDFHESWALRQVLALLEQNSTLLAVTVEGLRDEDERGAPRETWDGVDCALYYGARTADTCNKIIVDQLKYSGSHPQAPWTIARLTKNTSKKANNSVLRRLADAFKGLVEKRGGRAAGVSVRLVSNQPVDPRALEVMGNIATASKCARESAVGDDKLVIQATGLDGDSLQAFAKALDLSCRTGSRFELEESILKSVSGWGDDDVRGTINVLLDFIRRKMLPEAQGEPITAESVLVQLGFSSKRALFPCPAELKQIDKPVPREVARTIVKHLVAGEQFLCLHGPAGCGKTTVLQEVGASLPAGSMMVVFDCYGAGRYLDSDAYRHRPKDAFLQLSNELAVRLQIPLLLTRSKDTDYPRSFGERLNRSADAVAVRGKDALLVIAVDAADNSVTAASSLVPPEPSFVRDFVTLGGIAANMRLVVTARTSRLTEIATPSRFVHVQMSGFTPSETARYVRKIWKNPPDAWVDDFHHFSGGNPRVQSYALEYGAGDASRALEYLRPSGKALNQVFAGLLDGALLKSGRSAAVDEFCGALVVLPRPIPLEDLAAISKLTPGEVHDVCADLAPGIRFVENGVGFADEDFEHFIRAKVEPLLEPILSRVADRFMERRHTDAYAATHVASALHHAGRAKEIIGLLEEESEPSPIRDPVLRREVQLRRLQVAVRASSGQEDTVDAVRTILVGAEAIKTDAAIRDLVVANPDLAAAFMRDSAVRLILLDAKELEHHGPLLFHLMLEDARAGNLIAAREDYRQLRAWLSRRNDELAEQRAQGQRQDSWTIAHRDVVAQVEAVLLTMGAKAAVATLRSWRPRDLGASVARILVPRLNHVRKRSFCRAVLGGEPDRGTVVNPAYRAVGFIGSRGGHGPARKSLGQDAAARNHFSRPFARRLERRAYGLLARHGCYWL